VSAYVSADGHWVAFSSLATDLVPGDTIWIEDVFLRDRTNKTTVRCSHGIGGEADGASVAPSVSADGRFVAFASSATNLVAGDTNGTDDIFVFDRNSGVVARVSVSSSGVEGNLSSYPPPWGRPSISPDGRYVAFCSQASNLVTNDTNQTWDVFVHDRDFDHDGIYDEHVPGGVRTWRASVSSTGEEGHADSGQYGFWLSAYGRYVVFQSNAWNLIPIDVNGSDIFVHDNVNGATVLVSLDNNGAQAFGFHSLPSISADLSLAADGRYITWTSNSPVTPEDQNGVDDVFLRDRALDHTSLVSIGTGGIQADWGSSRSMVNASGSRIVFDSQASTFTPGDGTIAWDIFARDPQAGTTDVLSQPQGAGDSIWPTIDASGEIVAFSSSSPALVPGDANNLSDVFVQDCVTPVYVAFCAPGVGGIVPCPCGNPQVPAGSTKGCNNFAGGGTGGATLAATGVSSSRRTRSGSSSRRASAPT
jgi:Tol biopolymer transport system component